MERRERTQVLVVGAGPVGLYAALRLAERGITVTIIDEEWQRAAYSYGLGLHGETVARLEEAGLGPALRELGRAVDAVGFYEGHEERARIDLRAIGSPRPCALVLPQNELEAALEHRLQELGLRVEWSRRLAHFRMEEDKVVATVERWGRGPLGYAAGAAEWLVDQTRDLEADWVLGADGHRSTVRRMLDVEYPVVGPPESFAVFEFDTVWDGPAEIRVVLDEHATSALWPLPNGRARWSFELPAEQLAAGERMKTRMVQMGKWLFPELTRERLYDLMRQRAPWCRLNVGELHWAAGVRFERRLAGRFGRGRAWLAGDAAHLAGPIGGHSLNLGLREAGDLTEALAEIILHGASPTRLDEYAANRQREWRDLLGLEPHPDVACAASPWIRARADRLLSCIPASGAARVRAAQQVGLRIGEDETTDEPR